jgi:hypothetical protein
MKRNILASGWVRGTLCLALVAAVLVSGTGCDEALSEILDAISVELSNSETLF